MRAFSFLATYQMAPAHPGCFGQVERGQTPLIVKPHNPLHTQSEGQSWNPILSRQDSREITANSFSGEPTSLVESEGQTLPLQLQRRIRELASLRDGWDSRGNAKAPLTASLFACVTACRRISEWSRAFRTASFQEPFLAPNYDGCIQMEWNADERSLEVEARDQHWSIVGVKKNPEKAEEFFETEVSLRDYASVVLAYEWFKGSMAEWPL